MKTGDWQSLSLVTADTPEPDSRINPNALRYSNSLADDATQSDSAGILAKTQTQTRDEIVHVSAETDQLCCPLCRLHFVPFAETHLNR